MTEVVVKRPNGTLDVGLFCPEPSLTKQSESEACDINKIMAKYERTGLLAHLNANEAFYADVSNVPDYQGAFEVVRKADELFMSLPAEIRARFENDPGKYLEFVSNPANKDEMVKLGIVVSPKAVAPVLVEVVAKPPAP